MPRDNAATVVEFRLLGSLEAVENGFVLQLGGRQQRALLAMLLLRPNEVVSADQLIDALWGERPPPTASTMVHVYVSRLRKLLGRDLLVTRPVGYELALDPAQTDIGRFEALLAAAATTDDDAERHTCCTRRSRSGGDPRSSTSPMRASPPSRPSA